MEASARDLILGIGSPGRYAGGSVLSNLVPSHSVSLSGFFPCSSSSSGRPVRVSATEGYYNVFELRERHGGQRLTEHLEISFIELPRLPKGLSQSGWQPIDRETYSVYIWTIWEPSASRRWNEASEGYLLQYVFFISRENSLRLCQDNYILAKRIFVKAIIGIKSGK